MKTCFINGEFHLKDLTTDELKEIYGTDKLTVGSHVFLDCDLNIDDDFYENLSDELSHVFYDGEDNNYTETSYILWDTIQYFECAVESALRLLEPITETGEFLVVPADFVDGFIGYEFIDGKWRKYHIPFEQDYDAE